MSDKWASYIRTWWPLFLGHVAALLVTWVAARFGVEIDGALAFEAVGFAASAIVYWLGRKLENSGNSILAAVGRFILSLGLVPAQPTYAPPAEPAIRSRPGPAPY